MALSADHTQALHAAVWATVNRIAQEEGVKIGKPVSAEFVASLANVVFKHMETFGMDVEAFASHCRRTVVNSDDVLLCARRNENLHEILSDTLQEMTKKRPKNKHPQQ